MPWPPEPWPAAWRAWCTGDGPRRRRGKAAQRPGEPCGPEACGGSAWARAGAARGVQQLGGGDGATNKRGNSWNAMERGKHEHQCNSYLRFELLDEEDDGRS